MQTDFKSLDKLSPLVASQVPEFVRIEHPTFVAFLNAYYEWLETQGAGLRNVMDLAKVKDIDTTFDEYVSHFKKQYLLDFPENLAVNQQTGLPVEEKTLVKYIKQFYQAKGTEKTYEFLFRVLYDTNVEFYYPKVDILKASDGKWIQRKAIRLAGSQGSALFRSAGRKIYQKNAAGAVVAAASIVDVTKYNIGPFPIYELNISNINGTFNSSRSIEVETDRGVVIEPKIYSVASAITITNRGTNYRVGNKVIFTNASNDIGQNARAKVTQVDASGRILKIEFEDFGINYETAPTITIQSNTGSGFAGTCSIGVVCNFPGYYANNDGRLNTNKVLQDNHYYQNYSYVLKTEVVIDRYRDAIRRLLHPAGLGFFGQVLIKRCVESNLDAESALIKYEIPLIGHYLPYTNKTYDDLSVWFKSGATAQGYSPLDHDTILTTEPNPVSGGVAFVVAQKPYRNVGYPAADPWWIIYKHPNRRITDPVVARIEYDLKGLFGANSSGEGKKDFLNNSIGNDSWPEWTMTGNSVRGDWASSFTQGFKYAILKYNNTSEFRKITMGSFFNMPIGEEFHCSLEWQNQIANQNSPNNLMQYTTCYIDSSTTGGLSSTPINIPPTARITFPFGDSKIDNDLNGYENFVASATASSDTSPGTIVNYLWSTGATGITASITGNIGINYIDLMVTDNLGATGATTAIYTVGVPGNVPPIARIIVRPSNVQTDYDNNKFEIFELDGTSSSDTAPGFIQSYLWSNGSTQEVINYSVPIGATTVCLTVYDNQGATGATCVSLLVLPNPFDPDIIVGPTGIDEPGGSTQPEIDVIPTDPDGPDECECDDDNEEIIQDYLFALGFGGRSREPGDGPDSEVGPTGPDGPDECECADPPRWNTINTSTASVFDNLTNL